ncbi:MAG: hypothetical protein IPQ19_13760 [Bacteroidetes bacterium]|nr:hypothetical protein [Bacteroidota bacterium]
MRNINPERDDTSRFLLSFNLSELGFKMENDLFASMLTVNGVNCLVANQLVDKKSISDKDRLNKDYLVKYEAATNLVAVDIIEMNLDTARIKVELNKLTKLGLM